MKLASIEPRFVRFIPRELEDGVLYISEAHHVAVHKCASGCGEKVVTPLSPVEWQIRKRGNKVSLSPSIGNWNYACRSHYWIRDNRVVWVASMTELQIASVQRRDRLDKERYVAQINAAKEKRGIDVIANDTQPAGLRPSIWRRLLNFFLSK